MSARTPTDVWAVGDTHESEGDSTPLIEHWNGDTWQRYPYELPYGDECGGLLDVAALAADDVWAVGSSGPSGHPLMLHFDGVRWTPFTHLGGTNVSLFRAITAISPEDVWAVGPGYPNPGAVHWDGRHWTAMAMPTSRDALVDNLFGVTALAPGDVWAVGAFGLNEPYYRHTQAFHWDGREWTAVDTPDKGSFQNELSSVSGSASGDVWAVGTFGRTDEYQHRLYLHWDGRRWRSFHNAAPRAD